MNWLDYQALGQALLERYPDVNYLTVSDIEIVRLVTALPGFTGSRGQPDAAALAAVRFAWVAAAEGEDDASPFDGSS